MVQWLRLITCTAGGVVSIPGQEAKSPHATGSASPQKKPFLNVEDQLLGLLSQQLQRFCIVMTCGRCHCQGSPAGEDGRGASEPGASLPSLHLSFPFCKSGDLE